MLKTEDTSSQMNIDPAVTTVSTTTFGKKGKSDALARMRVTPDSKSSTTSTIFSKKQIQKPSPFISKKRPGRGGSRKRKTYRRIRLF